MGVTLSVAWIFLLPCEGAWDARRMMRDTWLHPRGHRAIPRHVTEATLDHRELGQASRDQKNLTVHRATKITAVAQSSRFGYDFYLPKFNG